MWDYPFPQPRKIHDQSTIVEKYQILYWLAGTPGIIEEKKRILKTAADRLFPNIYPTFENIRIFSFKKQILHNKAFFAGPKRGWLTPGFSIFICLFVCSYVHMFVSLDQN